MILTGFYTICDGTKCTRIIPKVIHRFLKLIFTISQGKNQVNQAQPFEAYIYDITGQKSSKPGSAAKAFV